jgi:methyl coenzyme M reductase subunit D
MAEKEKEKPITIRGEKTILSIFIGEGKITLSVSRKGQDGFEKIDRYIIPTDYLLFRISEKDRRVFGRICEIIDKID